MIEGGDEAKEAPIVAREFFETGKDAAAVLDFS